MTPAATFRWMCSGSRSSRIVFVIVVAVPADAQPELLVRDAEVVDELLVGARLLQRGELQTVQVLEQRLLQHLLVGGVLDDRRDGAEARLLRCAEAPLAHDELELARRVGERPHDDRLQHAVLPHGRDELRHRLLVEVAARLLRVRADVVGGERCEPQPGDGLQVVGASLGRRPK